MDEPAFHQIVADVLKGEIDKYELIMNRCHKAIFNYCYHMLGDYAEAEDCTQEAFLKAYRNLSKFESDKPFEAWLYRIASNQCIDYLRKRKLSRYFPFLYQKDQDNRHVDQVIEHKYYNPSVLRALAKLTAEERSLLILRCVEDKSYHEISLILQQNTTYLRKKFQRAAAKFRKHYAMAEGEETNEHGQRPGPETTLSKG
ncbi:RNA polymerase sigma factor [Paenibacillus lautus]|uniref:RNA polymerase sigma factor n=1 Tax=Paenibacillus lautus TaxID=1401 RepID=UPI003D2DE9EA